MNWWTAFSATILTSLGGALSLAFKAFVDRKKIKLDGTEVLSETALEQLAAMRVEVNGYRAEVVAFRKALHAHEVWDRKVIRTLAAQGIEIEAPPELWVF